MKKNNFKKIFVVFSLCFFLLSMFSISSFALNISNAGGGYLYKFVKPLPFVNSVSQSKIFVNGYLVDKTTGDMTSFSYLGLGTGSNDGVSYYFLSSGSTNIVNASGSTYDVYIDYSKNTISKSEVESVLSQYFDYSVTSLVVSGMFNNVNMSLVGGTTIDGVKFDGLLGMISKFGKFLVSSPLLLVLCIALPLVSFSVGLIIRIKNRA